MHNLVDTINDPKIITDNRVYWLPENLLVPRPVVQSFDLAIARSRLDPIDGNYEEPPVLRRNKNEGKCPAVLVIQPLV